MAEPVSAFILTWNPVRFLWENEEPSYDEVIRMTAAGQTVSDDWTVGNRRRGISPGDKAFLYRQHDNRGLVAGGTIRSGVERRPHWDGSGRMANYADVDWDKVLDYKHCLPLAELRAEVREVSWDHLQASGIRVEPTAVRKLSDMWTRHTGEVGYRLRQNHTGPR